MMRLQKLWLKKSDGGRLQAYLIQKKQKPRPERHFTYEQARNIAKTGTVESLTYDSVNGAIIATSAFSISAMITFATSVWNGDGFEIALQNAAFSSSKKRPHILHILSTIRF